jgi:ankyrin repeat protein
MRRQEGVIMSSRTHPPTRTLTARPDLDQLKRQAKELLEAFAAGDPLAVAEVRAHYQGANAGDFALHDAQLVLARAYGFASWPRLRTFVNGATVARLHDAVRAGDRDAVRALLAARPELVNVDRAENDEHKALHVAVLARDAEMVRFLMEQGADARCGIWPHRDATGALTIAEDRGYDEIAAIIRDAERRRHTPAAALGDRRLAELVAAFEAGDEDAIIAIFAAHPDFVHQTSREGHTPLHWAAARGFVRVAAWLLDRGANPDARTAWDETPFDVIGYEADPRPAARQAVAALRDRLRGTGVRTARSAIAAGDEQWLREQHAAGALAGQSGLLQHAIHLERSDMLRLLLELGLDPDESDRVKGLDEFVPTFGGPLRDCALGGHVEMAEILLAHGANPNTNVYAASSALSIACERNDTAMIALLERHGARHAPVFAAVLGLVPQARALLAESGASAARDLVWGAIGRPSPEIVSLALEHIDWPPNDPEWYGLLENGLYLGPDSDRPRHLEAFKMVLERSGADVRSRMGRTILHDIVASRGGLTAADRVAYATVMLDAGARLDARDDLLKSTPLGWACRWGRVELVRLFLDRGADVHERDAESWATPMAWAVKKERMDVIDELRRHGASS